MRGLWRRRQMAGAAPLYWSRLHPPARHNAASLLILSCDVRETTCPGKFAKKAAQTLPSWPFDFRKAVAWSANVILPRYWKHYCYLIGSFPGAPFFAAGIPRGKIIFLLWRLLFNTVCLTYVTPFTDFEIKYLFSLPSFITFKQSNI